MLAGDERGRGLIRLRPASSADREFLLAVYASTRAEELASVSWPTDQKVAFLRRQFEAQDAHYRAHYPGARFDVVEVAGRPAGRLYVHEREREIRVMDLALLPEFRGAGTGSELLRQVLETGNAARKQVTIHVERTNRAFSLYRRLGFQVVETGPVYHLLAWRPAG